MNPLKKSVTQVRQDILLRIGSITHQSQLSSLRFWDLNFWPFVPEQAHLDKYIYWSYTVKKLRYTTINSYVSSLSTLYKLKGCNTYIFQSFPTKTALKGIRNLDEINVICEKPRMVFSVPLLKILGHQIAISSCSVESKNLFWAAAVLLFFGSFRVSEILSGKEFSYDPLTTLLWSDIHFPC
jgi:hypothetical protein